MKKFALAVPTFGLSALTIGAIAAPAASSQRDTARPLRVAERTLELVSPDNKYANYACITTGMHPGQGQAGPGYDNATYNVGVTLQARPGNDDASQATPNFEGISCTLMYQGPDVFEMRCGAVFPPADVLINRPPDSPDYWYVS
jgi:hypothetical protein